MNDQQFEKQIKSTLDKSVDELDTSIQYRLQIARAKVLQSNTNIRPWYKRGVSWVGVTAVASVCVLSFTLFNKVPFVESTSNKLASTTDSTLFDTDTGIELYEEYDFYVWLSQLESNG